MRESVKRVASMHLKRNAVGPRRIQAAIDADESFQIIDFVRGYKQITGLRRIPIAKATDPKTKQEKILVGNEEIDNYKVRISGKEYMTDAKMWRLFDGEVVVEEKVDGHPIIILYGGYTFFCESLNIQHTVEYDNVPYSEGGWPDMTVVYEIMEGENQPPYSEGEGTGKWLSRSEKESLCHLVGAPVVPLVFKGQLEPQSLPKLAARLTSFGSGTAEGIILKNLKTGVFGKFINVEFQRAIAEEALWGGVHPELRGLKNLRKRFAVDDVHGKQIALMKFLSSVAIKLGVSEHVYVVGGAVRNFVLKESIKDLDIVVDSVGLNGRDSAWFAERLQFAIPAETSLVTNNYGVTILSVKDSWMLDGFNLQGEIIEIANARKESYGKTEGGKGYKPDEVVPATIQEDVIRREFRFNTLLWRLSELADGPDKAAILDLTGCGLSDLKQGIMHCPSDPDVTFGDDPTRILRIVKFFMKYGLKPDAETLAAAKRQLPKLWNVPHNAVSKILLTDILVGPYAKKALQMLKDLGALDIIAAMMHKIAPFRATILGWAKDQRVQLLFDAMDMGLPLESQYGFLNAEQFKRFRELAFMLPDNEARKLAEVIKQPGQVLDTQYLIDTLQLKGAAIKSVTDIARQLFLVDPKLMHDGAKATALVLKKLT